MGLPSCPESSINNYQYTLLNIPEERTSHLHRSRNLKPRHYKLRHTDKYLFKNHKVYLLGFFNKLYAPNECTEHGIYQA